MDQTGAISIPAVPPRAFAPLLGLERARLLELLRALDPVDWTRSSPCPGWTVLGLAVHLLGDDLAFVARQRDDHAGTPPPPGLDDVGFITWLDELQVEWVHAARRLSPRLAVELLAWTDRQVVETVSGHDPAARTAKVAWAGDGSVPAWLDHGRELSERWIHRQQILQALGRASDLRADLAEPVLDALRWAYPYRLASLDAPPGATVGIRVTGPEVRLRWMLACVGPSWHFAPSAGGAVRTELELTSEQAWRLLTNNYDRAAHGAILARGDPHVIETLLRTRAIIGAPE